MQMPNVCIILIAGCDGLLVRASGGNMIPSALSNTVCLHPTHQTPRHCNFSLQPYATTSTTRVNVVFSAAKEGVFEPSIVIEYTDNEIGFQSEGQGGGRVSREEVGIAVRKIIRCHFYLVLKCTDPSRSTATSCTTLNEDLAGVPILSKRDHAGTERHETVAGQEFCLFSCVT